MGPFGILSKIQPHIAFIGAVNDKNTGLICSKTTQLLMTPLDDFSVRPEPYGSKWDRLYFGMSQDPRLDP